jgi:hypothetical protein
VFTRFLVEGLATGNADLDGDGDISLDELYSYVYDRVIEEMPQQRPKKQENVEGCIVIARNIHWKLPAHVRNAIESPVARDRLTVLQGLAHLHRVGNDVVRAEVINETRRLIGDDSKAVSAAAMELITTLNPELARREAERLARREAEGPPWVPAVTSTPPHRRAKEQDEVQVQLRRPHRRPQTTWPVGAASQSWKLGPITTRRLEPQPKNRPLQQAQREAREPAQPKADSGRQSILQHGPSRRRPGRRPRGRTQPRRRSVDTAVCRRAGVSVG